MGKLVQVDTFTISSPTASIIIGGGSAGSSGLNKSIDTDDVYMIAFNNIQETVDNEHLRWRVTESGTPNPNANYDWTGKGFTTGTTFFNQGSASQTYFNSQMGLGTATGEVANGIIYIYNANNPSEYTFVSLESSQINRNAEHQGTAGNGVFTSASQVNGIQFYFNLGNISGGTFTLYKVL